MGSIRLAALLLVSGSYLWAALPSTMVWEVRPGVGSDSNGGGFDSAKTGTGTDYSQQNSAQYNFTDLVLVTTTTASSASHSFVTADVGNIIHISAGTGFTTGWYEITSVAAGVATLDRAAGSMGDTGGTWFEGGALLTMAQMNTNSVAGNSAWVKATATISVSAVIGITFASPSTANEYSQVAGYTTTRGDGGRVTITASSSFANNIVDFNVSGMLANFTLNCNSNSEGLSIGATAAAAQASNITAENCSGHGIAFNTDRVTCTRCTVTGTLTGGGGGIELTSSASNGLCVQCVSYSNATPGFAYISFTSNFTCIQCISAGNTGAGFSLGIDTGSFLLLDSIAYSNTSDGLVFTSTSYGIPAVFNTVFYGNGGYGINYSTTGLNAAGSASINYNAFGGNTSGARNGGVLAGANDVTLSADPFVAGASQNFALNSGGITAIGTAGYPGALTVGGTGFQPMGALVPQSALAICLGRVISSSCSQVP